MSGMLLYVSYFSGTVHMKLWMRVFPWSVDVWRFHSDCCLSFT